MIKDKVYRVMASVNPNPRANAKHTRLSSGRVPLYDYYKEQIYLNLSVVLRAEIKKNLAGLPARSFTHWLSGANPDTSTSET